MKLIYVAAFSALITAAQTAEISEFTAARARYEAALAASIKPVRDKYIQELHQLKNRAVGTKNFDLAVSVDRELKALGVSSGNDGIAVADPGGLQPLTAGTLPGTKWKAKNPKNQWHAVEFLENSKLVLSKNTGPVGGELPYEVANDARTITFKFSTGKIGSMRLSKTHREIEFNEDVFVLSL